MNPHALLAESDPELVEALRDEILSRGPITFAHFMERALYEPNLGYYAGDVARPGRAGDFLTAPESHVLFGQVLARQVAQCWAIVGEPDDFAVREYGAGVGALAAPLLEALRAEEPRAYASIKYQPVEINPRRLLELRGRLERDGTNERLAGAEPVGEARLDDVRPPVAGLDGHAGGAPRSEHATSGVLPPPFTGVVVANEYLDALPVHRLERRGDRLVEIGVAWRDGWFADVEMVPPPELADALHREHITLSDGQRAEVNPGIATWAQEVAAVLRQGWVIVIDYGMPAAELYGPTRFRGTLKGTSGQAIEQDPYRRVGRQDLTAHVDLTALELAAAGAGLRVLGSTTQARFLAALGLGELLTETQARARSITEAIETRSAAHWLLDPRGTGGFRVVVLGHDVPGEPRLIGLA